MGTPEFVPYLSVTNAAEAVGFYTRVFGGEPVHRLDMPDGRVMHCEFRYGDARIFLSEELPDHGGTPSPATQGATTVAIHLYVDDCDALVALMKENGASVLMEPALLGRLTPARERLRTVVKSSGVRELCSR